MKKKFLSIALILTLVFSFSCVFATETPKADVPENVVTNEDVLTDIDASVEDLINTTLVDSAVTDDVEPLVSTTEQKVYKSGSGNLVLADENVKLENKSVDGNLVVFAQNVELKDLSVNGDVAIFAQNIKVSNVTVLNGVTVMAAETINLDMYSTEGNIYTAAETLNALVTVRGLYVAAENVNVSNDSVVENLYDLKEVMPEDEAVKEVVVVSTKEIIKEKIMTVLAIVVKTFFVAGFVFLFTPEFTNKIKTDNIVKYIGFSALKGAGWTILIPIIIIALCCTGLGIGVAFATLAMYIILFWASVPFVSLAIMNVVTKEDDTKWKKFGMTLCIAFAIAILGRIPVIGGLVTVLVGFAGMGIVIGSLKCSCGCKKECKKAEVAEVTEVKEEPKVEEAKPEEDK